MTTLRILVFPLLLAAACARQPDPARALRGTSDGPASIALPNNLTELVEKADVKRGEALFVSKGCKACHNLTDVKLVGPGLQGVLERRHLNWVARMVLRPDVMVKQDAEAKQLFALVMTPMANQNVAAETELPALLALLKSL